MTTQDPELSAALGWPGGISDPVLDRKVLLQMVAALMQDKLWEDHRVRHLWEAQQAEPVHALAQKEEPQRAEAQRDALLEVLKYLDKEFRQHGRQHWPEAVRVRAAIKSVEGENT